MRVRGIGRGWRTLSRLALIGMIGGGAAACSTDASRLSDPFTNPFASNEPSATGSLGDEGDLAPTRAPAIRTPRIQSQELAAPGTAMSPRIPSARLAAAEPVAGQIAAPVAAGSVAGLNPDAGRMTSRIAPAAPSPKTVFGKGPASLDKGAAGLDKGAAGLDKAAEAKRVAAEKAAEAKKAAERAAEAKREAEEARKAAEKAHASKKTAETRPDKSGKAESPKGISGRADRKETAKAEEARLAKAEAAKEAKAAAARKVAEAKAAEAAAKASAKEAGKVAKEPAKETVRQAEKPAPVKVASADPAAAADSSESFRWPAKGRVINGYGSSGNEGINIAVPEGTPVKAAEDGTVAYAGSDVKGYGKLVLVRHANGFVSAYAHNGELDVRPGDKVKRGQTIAKSGATGNVTSPQLHFEIRKGATPVDPIPHLASN